MVHHSASVPHSRFALEITHPDPADTSAPLAFDNVSERALAVMRSLPEYPLGRYNGRGIVICGGGRFFASALTLIYMLRQQRCELPIELWYLGESEMSAAMREIASEYGVMCVDAYEVRKVHPMRLLNGWELKSYAVLHSSFEEVFSLDADNLPIINPEYLFHSPEYRQYGAIFWPDIHRRPKETSLVPALWEILGNKSPLGIPEFESAQMFINKAKCWRAIQFAVWLNSHSDFFYRYMYGDKETFHLAWATTRTPFGMPSFPIEHHNGCLCQHDFEGRRVFQHRHGSKFELHDNVPVAGFKLESQCLIFLARLAARWDGRMTDQVPKLDFAQFAPKAVQDAYVWLVERPRKYTRINFDTRPLQFLPNGTIGEGVALYETFWSLRHVQKPSGEEEVWLAISSSAKRTCELLLNYDGVWRGKWEHSGEMFVEIQAV